QELHSVFLTLMIADGGREPQFPIRQREFHVENFVHAQFFVAVQRGAALAQHFTHAFDHSGGFAAQDADVHVRLELVARKAALCGLMRLCDDLEPRWLPTGEKGDGRTLLLRPADCMISKGHWPLSCSDHVFRYLGGSSDWPGGPRELARSARA